MRRVVIILALVLFAFLSLAPAVAAEPSTLARVERRTPDDLRVLRAADLPVVLETRPCLFLLGSSSDVARAREAGFQVDVLDADAAGAEYALVGLRPDSDIAAVHALGRTLLAEENWTLLRLAPGTTLEALSGARVFVTRVSRVPLGIPVPPEPPLPRGAAAGADATADPLVQKIVNGVSTTDIDGYWNDLTSNPPTGTRYSTAQGCRDSSAYCLTEYGALGIPAQYQNWNVSHAPNVIGTLEGGIRPDDVYIVVGHLDDLPSSGPAPGADDNASGSVTVLESAKSMSCWSFKSTVKFLNVTGEEFGLYGSEAYADDAWARGEKIRGVLNFDMNGWAGDGIPAQEDLDLDYDGNSQWLAQRFVDAAAAYGTGLAVNAFYCPSLTASDHYSFWQKGWSALCGITDNEGYCGRNGNYPYYHTSNDTIANCGSPAFFYSTVKATVATLAELAEPFKISFDRAAYGCGVPLRVVVGDRDLDTNPSVAETVNVRVWSTSEPAGETLTLTERSVHSRFFEGTLPTTSAPPVSGDGALTVAFGDVLHAEYVDALDCDGATGATYTATAATDCVAPTISSVGESGVTDVAATIQWTTSEPADSVVNWGTGTPPDQNRSDSTAVTAHQVQLTGLQQCTVYWYEVRSTDPAGNLAVENNGGRYFHFETQGNFGGQLQPCHEGKISLDRSVVGCSDALAVRLIDIDLNVSTTVADTATVTVTSSTETVPEVLTLVETGPNTSTFTGSIATAPGAAVTGDGILQSGNGDLLTATYHDQNDGTGASAVAFVTGQADCAGPVGSAVRVTDVTDDGGIVRWTTSEPSDSRVDWGTTPALGNVVSDAALVTSHALTLRPVGECGRVYFRVTSRDAYGNARVFDATGNAFEFNAYRIPGIFRDTFETSTGWTLEGEWQIGAPEGKGTAPADPTAAFDGTKVLGHDLTGLGKSPGDYEAQKTERAISPVINGAALTGGKVMFRRWLNVGVGGVSSVEVRKNGTWYTVFTTNSAPGLSESDWSLQSVDISAYADGNSQLQIAFKQYGGLQTSPRRAGWNVDRFVVKGGDIPDFDACGACGGAPTFAGLASASDVSGCADTGISLSWEQAPAWGTGRGGTYAVYRDTNPSFTPGPANRIAAGIVGTSYTDTGAPNGVELYYVVRAENDETCGGGPNNGGVTDANLVRRSATDQTSQPSPGDVGASVRLAGINDAHIRLTWDASPTAARYRVYRASEPQGPFVQVAETTGTLWEDRDELGTLTTRYYVVRAVDACGNE